MHIFYGNVVAADEAKAVVHIHVARAHRFDFIALQNDTRFVFFFDKIFKRRAFVRGDNFHKPAS
jgi:hypothetical protein